MGEGAWSLGVVGFVPFFAAMWIGVNHLLGAVSGWKTLATDYGCDTPFTGSLLHMRSGRLRFVGYNNCLNLGSNADGLYVSTLFLFRLGHPPLFIPWSDVSDRETKQLFFFTVSELRFAKHPNIKFELSKNVARDLLAQRPQRRSSGLL